MRFLLDTNVLSEPIKPSPNQRVVRWLADHDVDAGISVLTLGEIVKGIHLMSAGKRRLRTEAWLADIEQHRLVPIDAAVMREWGVYYAKQSKQGRVLDVMDSLLAATALAHGLTIASRNIDDFPDVPGLNPRT